MSCLNESVVWRSGPLELGPLETRPFLLVIELDTGTLTLRLGQYKTSNLASSRSVLTCSSAPSLLRPLSPAIRSALRHLLVQHPTPVACARSRRPFGHSSTPHASLLLDSVRMPPKVVCGNPLFLKWLEGLLRFLLPDTSPLPSSTPS